MGLMTPWSSVITDMVTLGAMEPSLQEEPFGYGIQQTDPARLAKDRCMRFLEEARVVHPTENGARWYLTLDGMGSLRVEDVLWKPYYLLQTPPDAPMTERSTFQLLDTLLQTGWSFRVVSAE